MVKDVEMRKGSVSVAIEQGGGRALARSAFTKNLYTGDIYEYY